MGKITIIEHNSADKDTIRAYFLKGETGSSAYELAVKNGYIGTEEDWLDAHLDPTYYYTKTEVDELDTQLFNSLSGDLGDETTARQTADTTLQGAIDDETLARQTADTSLSNSITAETSSRETAVTNLQNQITALSEKNIIMAFVQNNITVTGDSGYVYQDIPLITKIVIGNKLTFSENKIFIGAGVSKIKVSAIIHFRADTTDGQRYLIIKHGVYNSAVIGLTMHYGNSGSLCIPDNIIDVNEGDTISLSFTCYADDIIYADSDGTYITVEVIE